MNKRDFEALGYGSLEHAGFSWLATDQGRQFLLRVEDWSHQSLALREGWTATQRRYHIRYLAKEGDSEGYFIKFYSPKETGGGFVLRRNSRARREFDNTVAVYREGIPTVLPLASGEEKNIPGRGILIYPFLSDAVSLSALYQDKEAQSFAVGERHRVEIAVGKMVRRIVDAGLQPRDLIPDHLLVRKLKSGHFEIYWVDLERVKAGAWLKTNRGRKTLAKLLARMEWLRSSGYRVTRASMMRIANAFFRGDDGKNSDPRGCRRAVRMGRRIAAGWSGK